MRRWGKLAASLLLLLTLCACGNYESRVEGAWQGDGSLRFDFEDAENPPSFASAEQWVFDGNGTAIATVRDVEVMCSYRMTGDTLTLNDGGAVSWGIRYELKGGTLRIGSAEFTKAG